MALGLIQATEDLPQHTQEQAAQEPLPKTIQAFQLSVAGAIFACLAYTIIKGRVKRK